MMLLKEMSAERTEEENKSDTAEMLEDDEW